MGVASRETRVKSVMDELLFRIAFVTVLVAFIAVVFVIVERLTPTSRLVGFDRIVIQGTVVAVADGNTLTLRVAHESRRKIRIAGIDAPKRNQPFGNRARRNLARLAYGKTAQAEGFKVDRDGSYVCTVNIDGQDVGLRQIRVGFAWWYRKYADEQSLEDRQRYEFAENEARRRRWGFWADASPVPPWEWRWKKALMRKSDRGQPLGAA